MTTESGYVEAAMARSGAEPGRQPLSFGGVCWGVVGAAASAQLTTILLLAAIGIVFVGTLEQVYKDIWLVVEECFRTWVCWVEPKVLFPPSFFPWAARTDWESLRIQRFPIPGGALIGSALMINLTAAHAVRFRLQARGARLVGGLLALAAGIVATWLVIRSGHNRQGVQAAPLLEWSTLWLLIKIGLVALWIASAAALAYVSVKIRRRRVVELVLLGFSTVGLSLVLAWIFVRGESAILTHSSLRILYQLIQGQIAALVLLGACVVLFRNRAGIALLHGGVGLMMFGELFVSCFAAEQRMTLTEGQTVSYTRDIRSVELAINSPSEGGRDSVVVVPMSKNGEKTSYSRGGVIRMEGLPFNLEVLRYYQNSTVRSAEPGDLNLATTGTGTRFAAREAPPKAGVQGGEVDLASAYVKFIPKDHGKDLGVLLVSQHFESAALRDAISADGKSYGVQLRFERHYKPYKVTLLDVRRDDYVGTAMPRNYSSRVRLRDPSRKVDFESKIWMNNPLRYAGETFYQSGYSAGRGGKEVSTLQVVKNTGWMIPYVACMIAATGMLAHFVLVLVRFLRRIEGGEEEEAPGDPADRRWPPAPARGRPLPALVRCLVPLAVVLLGAAWVANKATPSRSPDREMKLEEFGRLPLMYEGRVKPFDTLARNSLRVLSNRETFVDASGVRRPAIRWLLDVIARPEEAEKHRVLRIDNLEVLEAFGLERRPGFRYARGELQPKASEFEKQVALAQRQPPPQRTLYQRKLLELYQRASRYHLLSDAFHPLPFPAFPTREEIANHREEAAKTMAAIGRLIKEIPRANRILQSMHPPLAAPVGPSEQPWLAYAAAENSAYAARLRGEAPQEALAKLTAVFDAYKQDDAAAFNEAVGQYRRLLAEKPPAGLNMSLTDLEAYFNHVAPFYHSIPLYVAALLLTVFGWLLAVASARWAGLLRSSAFWLIVFALAVHTLALYARVLISGRPPVTNLYSSAIFIGWGCVVLGLLLELVFRLGVGNFVSCLSGIGTLIIAHFLAGEGDTIKVLQAVLDTQFWLTVHVLTVTLGYSATFLAGLLGLVAIGCGLAKTAVLAAGYVRGVGGGRPSSAQRLSLSRPWEVERVLAGMIYGTICFAAFTSFIGTVLGGLWADDSWGRFWGWDPKENGALIIVLWTALVLHARWAGIVKERGLAVLAVGGSIVTAWSWFGVNELGVGLHTYGFTEGAARALILFWISQLAAIGVGLILIVAHWLARLAAPREPPVASAAP